MGGQILDYEAKRILKRGEARGLEQGLEQANMNTAKKMLLKNMDISLIMEITELPLEKLEMLQHEITNNK